MASVLEELGDGLANRKPAMPNANSPHAIVTHSLGVIELWIGHVLLGRPLIRDIAEESTASGPMEPLLARLRASKGSVFTDFGRPFPAKVPHSERGERDITKDLLVTNDMQPRPDQRQRLSRIAVLPHGADPSEPAIPSQEETSVEAARSLLEGDLLRLDELWLHFWAEGGDADILELDAYLHREIRLSEVDTRCFHAVIQKVILDDPESRAFP
ncbi:hypothetical protein AR689_20820 [Arthrobacter sp. EpRS71]|nr:hypothetical protein AR689_20820 [Arthrobacter sp. EpRS71]